METYGNNTRRQRLRQPHASQRGTAVSHLSAAVHPRYFCGVCPARVQTATWFVWKNILGTVLAIQPPMTRAPAAAQKPITAAAPSRFAKQNEKTVHVLRRPFSSPCCPGLCQAACGNSTHKSQISPWSYERAGRNLYRMLCNGVTDAHPLHT